MGISKQINLCITSCGDRQTVVSLKRFPLSMMSQITVFFMGPCSLWSLNNQKINCDSWKNTMDSLRLASACMGYCCFCVAPGRLVYFGAEIRMFRLGVNGFIIRYFPALDLLIEAHTSLHLPFTCNETVTESTWGKMGLLYPHTFLLHCACPVLCWEISVPLWDISWIQQDNRTLCQYGLCCIYLFIKLRA